MNWFIVKLLLKHHENQPTVAKCFKMNCILATFYTEAFIMMELRKFMSIRHYEVKLVLSLERNHLCLR